VTAERGERRLAVGRGLDAEPLALEILAEHVADRLLVVDDQNVPQVVGVAAHAGKYLIRPGLGSRHSAGLANRGARRPGGTRRRRPPRGRRRAWRGPSRRPEPCPGGRRRCRPRPGPPPGRACPPGSAWSGRAPP